VAAAGVAFSLTMVFLLLGFLGSVANTATLVLDQLDFDVALVSPGYRQLAEPDSFPRIRLYEAAAAPGVARATPFYVGVQTWRTAAPGPNNGKRRPVLVLAYPPAGHPFRLRPDRRPRPPFPLRVAEADLGRLSETGTMLVDARSHPTFAPREPGSGPEVGDRRMNVVGQFSLGTGFASDGTILVGAETFHELLGGYPLERVSVGLITLEPGSRERAAAVAAALRQSLTHAPGGDRPDLVARRDVEVLTRDELLARDTRYWIRQKSIGLIFTLGVAIALVVGLVVVYQVLSSDIVDHFREYATLKALGYTNRYLASVVLTQALYLAVFGYVPALGAAFGLYEVTREFANLPVAMTPVRAVLVFVMASVMCAAAALLSVRKVTQSDPASLF
jgi:putative ABC transport system permease protein